MIDQVAAGLESYFWPKIFFDFLTHSLDGAVRPVPVLQTVNILLGFLMLAWEWPLGAIAGSGFHRSLELRLAIIPVAAISAGLIYQGTNAAVYYLIGMAVYFWAYSEGEVSNIKYRYLDCVVYTNIFCTDHLRKAVDSTSAWRAWCACLSYCFAPALFDIMFLFLNPHVSCPDSSPGDYFRSEGWRGMYIYPNPIYVSC